MADFTAIAQFRFRQLYGDDNKFSLCSNFNDLFDELFETTNRGLVFDWDDKSQSHSVFIDNSRGIGADRILKVNNPRHEDLFLWHIDGVMYQRGTKCDCALLNTSSLCFVEFKSEAQNNTPMQAQNEYLKASSQIEVVLNDLVHRAEHEAIDLHNINIRAIAVFNKTVSRNNASQKFIKRKFQKEFEKYGIRFDFLNEIDM